MAGWTQADLDALDAQIASGASRVAHSDKDITMRSQKELLQLRSIMAASLGQNTNRVIRTVANYRREPPHA